MELTSIRSRRGLFGLLAVNAALLGALAWVTFAPSLSAQGFRSRGSYNAVAGTVPGIDASAIYIVDETNEQLLVLAYNPNTNTLTGLGGRDLAVDMRTRP